MRNRDFTWLSALIDSASASNWATSFLAPASAFALAAWDSTSATASRRFNFASDSALNASFSAWACDSIFSRMFSTSWAARLASATIFCCWAFTPSSMAR